MESQDGHRNRRRTVRRALREFIAAREAGAAVTPDEFASRFPEEARSDIVSACAAHLAQLRAFADPDRGAETTMPAGTAVGPWLIEAPIAAGASGEVFRARHATSGRTVALKVLHPGHVALPAMRERWERELRVGTTVRHENLVAVVDSGVHDGRPFAALTPCCPRSLHEVLAETRARPEGDGLLGGATRVANAIRITTEVARALGALHAAGVVHRDVKPKNILVGEDGRAYLGDLGLARPRDAAELTRTGDVIGTFLYLSPEQCLARRVPIDHRSDLFSLGIVLYEMLTLRRPFSADTEARIIYEISFATPVGPRRREPRVGRDLEVVCLKALEKNPEHRYGSAAAFADDLDRLRRGESPAATPPGAGRRLRGFLLRHRRTAAAAAAVALCLGGWFASEAWKEHQSSKLASRFEFRGDASGIPLDVVLVPVDPMSGLPVGAPVRFTLASSTPDSRRAKPGHYLITIADRDGRFAELRREIRGSPGEVVPIAPRLAAKQKFATSMVEIAGGDFTLEDDALLPKGNYALPGFLIDRTEVTNADWEAYCKEAGVPLPAHWPRLANDWPRTATLPVVRVSVGQARAYAEFHGKRLATPLEWSRAARSKEVFLYPFGNDDADLATKAVLERVDRGARTKDQELEAYLRFAAPVGSTPGDRSREGVLDTLGNVREWVEGVPIVTVDGVPGIFAGHAMAKGAAFDDRADRSNLRGVEVTPAEGPFEEASFGFRCAKSVVPDR